MSATGQAAERAAREARDHPVLDGMARAGFVAYGVVYLLIGWLAAQLALGRPQGSASGKGAFAEIAQKPLGAVVLWLAAGGLAALAVWQVCQAVGGHRDHDGVRRLLSRAGSAGRAVVLAGLAVLAVRTALGGSGGSGSSGGVTGRLLGMPGGPLLVVAAGAVVLAIAGASAYRGLSDRWRKDIDAEGRTGEVGRAVEVLARAGYLSRGLAFGVIALLLVRAGVEHDPSESGGLDQAIMRFRDEPAGPWLMVVVAVGLACFGAYHLVRAWYLRAE
ncbi:DUF1206 domain-containing protein [Nocardioides sp. LML1-1-1.1]|uniref:DUF1206 domain-containing protein n=1 Tax=Nocardioides sp. LML1-1-1.1 TaxID=3135248 RepID=UPI00342DF851